MVSNYRVLSSEEVVSRSKSISDLWSVLRAKDSMLSQRAKSRCLNDGGANTSFFHVSIKSRSRRNSILATKVLDVVDIRREVVKYFYERVKEKREDRPRLYEVPFRSLSVEDNLDLSSCFCPDELDEVVALSDGRNRPGSNGFTLSFFKRLWYLLKEDVRVMF